LKHEHADLQKDLIFKHLFIEHYSRMFRGAVAYVRQWGHEEMTRNITCHNVSVADISTTKNLLV
jgi:hypothetical protein